jgi:hypothetical protein
VDKKIIIAATFMLLSFASLAMPAGKSVTMNLAFSIGQQPSNDVLNASGNFSSSYDTAEGTVVAIVAAGQGVLSSSVNNSYGASANMISLTQPADANRFLIVMTNGSSAQIAGKTNQVRDGFFSTVFGVLPQYAASSFPVYLLVIYDNANIMNNTIFSGPEEILIRNAGPGENGAVNITIEATK